MSLLRLIETKLSEGKTLPFVEFMEMALYAPNVGYYNSLLPKFGQAGDFITAPELSPLFGKAVANQCLQIMTNLGQASILEYGAGTGKLCVDILSHLESLQCLPERYAILELSPSLRQRQQTYIEQTIPHLASRLRWLDSLPSTPFNGVVLANEVLDAMPVHRFILTTEGLLESQVTLNAKRDLVEIFRPCQNPRLQTYIQTKLSFLQSPYLSEVNLYLDAWLAANYALLDQGAVLLLDYGFPRHEYYHPDRNKGTLMCHYQHKAHTDPLIHLGQQDITAHVDFTHVAEAADTAGFHVAGYTSQAAFLLSNGLLDYIPLGDLSAEMQAKQAIKRLTQPEEMGELFKVIALTKNLPLDLQGFQLQDRRHYL